LPAPAPTTTTTATTAAPASATTTSTTNKITLINPTTEQSVTFENPEINKENIQGYLASGYQLAEASGQIPSWFTADGVSSNTQTPEQKAQAGVDQAAVDLKSLTDNLINYTISDADLKAQADAITTMWDARIEDMKKVNASREGAINTLGTRLGSQYAGGAGGQFGGIVSEEERQGIARIGELEAQKQAAIAAAKLAARTQNWQVYSKQVDLAESLYTKKVEEVKNLQTATAAQNQLIATTLKNQEDSYYNHVEKPINDVLTSVIKNNAPKEIIDAINSATTPAEAIAAAGSYLQDVPSTGIVGEYLYYKRQAELAGQTPLSFDDYQTRDANRRVSIAAAGSGLSNQTLTRVQSISNQFDGEQIVKDYNNVATQVSYIQNLGKTPTEDIARIYAFAKVMDPNSVVREGEYKTVQDYSTALMQRYGLNVKRVFTNSGFLTDEARNFMNTTLTKRLNTQYQTYKNVADEYARRINKITGANDGADYITNYSAGYQSTGSQIISGEADARQKLLQFHDASPQNAAMLDELHAVFPSLSATDVLKRLNIQ
jgi:hypothetical protein